MREVRGQLEREVEVHKETRQKLVLVEKEVKSLSLMGMELEDYQRSIQVLEGEVGTKEQLLEKARSDIQTHQERSQHLSRDMGTQ